MKDRTKNWIILILFLIVLTGAFFLGYSRYPIWNSCTGSQQDTVIINHFDTLTYHIRDTVPWLIVKRDTVIIRDTIPAIVDTVAILQAYYSFYTYSRTWSDSSLTVTLRDVISENRVFDSWFDYKILRPTEIINTTNINYSYSKYLYIGGSITLPDAKYSNVGLYGAFSRTLIGIGYIPYQKGVQLSGAYRIVKLK